MGILRPQRLPVPPLAHGLVANCLNQDSQDYTSGPERGQTIGDYDGGCPGTLRLHVDGSPDAERTYYTLDTMPGYAMHLGTSWNTAAGTGRMLSGSLARLQVYDYARTAEEVIEAAACGR